MKDMNLQVAEWKYGKRWVYSATYDEALAELHQFVVPVHDRLGIPGHVEAVAGHIGKVRQLFSSSFNGMWHMGGEELRELIERGWGVGNHSWSHGNVWENVELELKQAKDTIETACDYPINLYTAPNNNSNLAQPVLDALEGYGYLGGMSITDDINYPDFGLWINRPPLHEKFSDLYDSAFDPYKRIAQAKKHGGWIVDYLHCPMETAVHDYKDVSAAHHAERFETVASEGKYDCWFANPDRVVDYRYLRGAVNIIEQGPGRFELDLSSAKKEIICRELTFITDSVCAAGQFKVTVDGREIAVHQLHNRSVCFTAEVKHGTAICFENTRGHFA